jgi:hypothetical protein
VVDLYGVALPDAKADRAADIVENGLGARCEIGVTRIESDGHIAASDVETDAAD